METIAFKRGIDPKHTLDIGEFRNLRDNIKTLQNHPAVVSLHIEEKKDEVIFYNRHSFKFTGKLLHILVDTSKTPNNISPGDFLIEYLPAKYFQRVDVTDWSSQGGMSDCLFDIKKLEKIYRADMFIADEYAEEFPNIEVNLNWGLH